MYKLIEIELTRIRKMAKEAEDELLLYLIDLAIIEANAKDRATKDSVATAVEESTTQKPEVAR